MGEPAPEEHKDAAARHKGSVKWFNVTKGFGFITPDGGGEDLFVHQTNINSEGFRSLREGEAVEFDVETSADGRSKAVNISGPGGTAPQGAPHRPAPRAGAYGTPPPGAPGFAPGRGRGGRGRGPPGAMGGRGPPGMPGYYGGYEAGGYPPPGMPPFYVGYYFPPQGYEHDMTGGRGRGRFPGPAGMYAMPPQPYPAAYPGGYMPAGPPGPGTVGPPAGQAATPSGLQVVVHNLPWTCTWQQLKDFFAEWKVVHADVVYDSWERSRGFGTVRFTNMQDADAACQKLNNSQIEGRTISVRIDRFA